MQLRDALGRAIATAECACGRTRVAGRSTCCDMCDTSRANGRNGTAHTTPCNLLQVSAGYRRPYLAEQ